MTTAAVIYAVVYAVGVLVGLARTDGRLPARMGLSLLWPIGPLAFAATVVGLLVVAAVAWPGAARASR